MRMLRIATAGSVDDGKSTLIGRLLHDTGSIYEDQLEALRESALRTGDLRPNLALLTDGLKAEREQGITIDVAYRYFSTPKRKFVVADTPGHVQYTRNMVTGASTADAALILVDARNGVSEQTSRHAFISSLLGIRHLVLCVNKMDLVGWREEVFRGIVDDFSAFISRLEVASFTPIPVCALEGDNVVEASRSTPWYGGPTLLGHLEEVYVGGTENHIDARFPVQLVVRPGTNELHDFRGYAGRVAGGVFKPGDRVIALPSGFETTIEAIHLGEREIDEAFAPMSVTLTLADDIDIARGDLITKVGSPPEQGQDLDVMLCWLSGEQKLDPRGRYLVRHGAREVAAKVTELAFEVDVNTLHRRTGDVVLGQNGVGRVGLRVAQPLHFDRYARNRAMGSLLLLDRFTGDTLAAGMIR